MRASIETQVRRALWRLVFWRLVGDAFSLPRRLLSVIAAWLLELERALFYFELDAARVYRALTGIDPAHALGERLRYGGAVRGRAERDQAEALGEGEDGESSSLVFDDE